MTLVLAFTSFPFLTLRHLGLALDSSIKHSSADAGLRWLVAALDRGGATAQPSGVPQNVTRALLGLLAGRANPIPLTTH